jgi:hypothetical protein
MKGSLEELSRPMWKYGFLDLTFETGDALLGPADKINRAVIRELGYSPRPPHCDSELSERSCLEVLIESMIDRGCFLRLFLDSKWSKDFMGRFMETASQQPRGPEWDSAVDAAALALKSRMPSWFPVDFTIEDACLTNSDAIWLARHEYL